MTRRQEKPLGDMEKKMGQLKRDIQGQSHSKGLKRKIIEPSKPKNHKRQKLDLLQVFRKYSAAKVKIPKDRTQWAKKMADTHLECIRLHCNKYWKYSKKDSHALYFSHFVYTGSFYEHLKTEDADELDVLVVLDSKKEDNLEIKEVVPGYVRIKATDRANKYVTGKFTSGNERYVNPKKVRSKFFGVVQKAINNYSVEKNSGLFLKVSDHGPAIKLLIKDKVKGKKVSIDLVPTFLFKDRDLSSEGKYYVAKELPEQMLWRSLDEKKIISDHDKEDTSFRQEALKLADTHLEYLRKHCNKNWKSKKDSQYFSHFVYTGSFIEHLTAEDSLNVLAVLDTKKRDELKIEKVERRAYARIRATDRSSKYVTGKFTSGNRRYMNPKKVRSKFYSVIQKAIKEYNEMEKKDDALLEVQDHGRGPAITLLIKSKDKVKEKNVSVHLVPTFLFKDKDLPSEGKYYVAKELPEEWLWRRSFSLDEKRILMEKLDVDHGCRKEVLKIIKTIVRNDSTLASLSSYHLKTTFLHYIRFMKGNEKIDWSGQSLPYRCYDILSELCEHVKKKVLNHYFIPELNLLEELAPTTLENIEDRLTKLLGENQHNIRNVLAVKPGFDRFAPVNTPKKPRRKRNKKK